MSTKQLTHQPKAKGGRGAIKTRLTTLSDVIGELGHIYRAVKARKLDMERGKAMAWILGQLRCALETQSLQALEEKLAAIEEAGSRGYTPAARPALISH